jgi:hypothetical protein
MLSVHLVSLKSHVNVSHCLNLNHNPIGRDSRKCYFNSYNTREALEEDGVHLTKQNLAYIGNPIIRGGDRSQYVWTT